jgi:hypothetical protein
LPQEELDEESMGLYTLGSMLIDPLHGKISPNSALSHAVKLKLGVKVQQFSFEMMAATEMIWQSS